MTSKKRRRTDLVCVVCQGFASGYNFSQISCHSCKEFFRRTIFLPKNKIKCLNSTTNRCLIRYDIKPKCQQCRLVKCLEFGMRKDLLKTNEEKQLRQKCLNENQYFYLKQNSNRKTLLTDIDRTILNNLKISYVSALKISPKLSSIVSFDNASEKEFSLKEATDIDGLTVVRLVYFIRNLLEFQSLNEQDRFTLIKSNFSILFVLHDVFIFDSIYRLWHSDNGLPFNLLVDETLAQNCKSLFILIYGYDLMKIYIERLRTLKNLIGKDSILIQLLMIILIHSPGIINVLQSSLRLIDNQHVFQTQSKYIDLLFRYLNEEYSFEFAAKKMMNFVEQIFHIQKLDFDFQEKFKNKIDSNQIHPLISSVFHL